MRRTTNWTRVGRFERAIRCAARLYAGLPIDRRWLVEAFGMSSAQAKRDLDEMERVLPVMRERGVLNLIPGSLGGFVRKEQP